MTRSAAGWRFRELAVEAVMVVFAVMVALAVDEWREQRQYVELADRARVAVMAEVRANLDELRETDPILDSALVLMRPIVQGAPDVRAEDLALSLELPDFSNAAWRAAQLTQASGYLDYDWVIEVSRAYETQAVGAEVQHEVIRAMADILSTGPDRERIVSLYGPLLVLVQVFSELELKLEALLPPTS